MVAPTAAFPALLAFVGTIFTGLAVLTLWIWRHTTSLDGEDEDRIRELENYQESSYKSEFTDLYLTIEGITQGTSPPEDVGWSEFVFNIIEREIEEDDLDSLVNELDKIGDAEEKWDEHRECYKHAYMNFGRAAITLLLLGVVMTVSYLFSDVPFDAVFLVVYAGFGFFAVNYGWDAVNDFIKARELKEEFEDMWREYKRVN